MSKGYVYILSNVSMPGMVKIGKTTRDPNQRAAALYQTGVPTPFSLFACVYSPDCDALERDMHLRLDRQRVSPDREFFKVPLDEVDQTLLDLHREQIEGWLEEFIPDHVIVDEYEHVDISGLSSSARQALLDARVTQPEIPEVLYQLTGGDLQPAIARQAEIRERRRQKYLEKRAEREAESEA